MKNSDQNVHRDSWQRTASEMTFVHLIFNSLAIITVKNVYLHIFAPIYWKMLYECQTGTENAIKIMYIQEITVGSYNSWYKTLKMVVVKIFTQ